MFHKPEDYDAFVDLLALACDRLRMRVFGWCLMPNHFHLVVRPYADDDLGRWMQWLMTSHVRRYHRHYESEGHVWQGRFKAFPVQADDHLLTVLRYVERNPLRAGLVDRAEAWRWSSLALRAQDPRPKLLAPCPVKLPRNWPTLVNRPQSEAEVQGVRKSIARGAPLGSAVWQRRTADKLGLESTLRPRGRPRKTPPKK